MAKLFANNASSTLAADIDDLAIQLDLAPGTGALFPATTAVDNDDFMITIEDAAGNREVCRCFERVNDRLTIDRAQEGTAAQSFLTGAQVDSRLTAGVMGSFVQSSAGGVLDLGATGTIVAGTHQGDTGLTTNELKIPDDGSTPTIGGRPVVVAGDAGGGQHYGLSHYFLPTGVIQMWSGSVGSIPSGWALCDGSSVGGYITPNLSDVFVKGAGAESPGATGGSSDTGAGGDHNHGGATGGHALTIDELPAHTHPQVDMPVSRPQQQPGSVGSRSSTGQTVETGSTGGGQAHTHPLSASGTHTHPNSEPPYFVVAYIVKLPDLVTPA